MKLICEKCNTTILAESINLQEGICHCKSCNEFFKIADFIDSDEEVRRTPKPLNTKVKIWEDYDKTFIEMRYSKINWFMLFFTVVWNVISWSFIFSGQLSESGAAFLIFPFIGLVTFFIFFYRSYGISLITISKENILIKKSLLNIGITKTKTTQQLNKITESVVYEQNYQPVYGVELQFTDEPSVKFGSMLDEAERKWLIGELYELKDKYTSKGRYTR